MVYTLTFNPAIDYVVKIENFEEGITNKSAFEEIYPGGKGINVSIVIKNLGVKSKILGFKAGFTGEYIDYILKNMDCETDFVQLESGYSRINTKIKSEKETEINAKGPDIPSNKLSLLIEKIENIGSDDIIVIGGSVPHCLPNDIYEKILEKVHKKNVKTIVDTTGKLLLNTLKFKPFLIKPNLSELEEIFGQSISSDDEIIKYAKKLKDLGAINVMISMGGKGAILITEQNEILKKQAPKGTLINSVGAGDSMVAGFLAQYLSTKDYEKSFNMAIAAGSATAFNQWLASKTDIYNVLNKII